jgi:hypothetical protein
VSAASHQNAIWSNVGTNYPRSSPSYSIIRKSGINTEQARLNCKISNLPFRELKSDSQQVLDQQGSEHLFPPNKNQNEHLNDKRGNGGKWPDHSEIK